MESTEHKLKPCIQCGKECDILPVELGDSFTLTYLRVCSPECMFFVAHDFLYKIREHKSFRNHLYDLQNAEDAALRDEFIDTTTKMALESFRKHAEANPNMLAAPAPDIFKIFAETPAIPFYSSTPMKFYRLSKEERIKLERDHVKRLKEQLKLAELDLAKAEND